MKRVLIAVVGIAAVFCGTAAAQNREEKVRNDKKTVEAAGYWIYNDLPKAFAEAKQSGKPIVAVLRCIPCEECVKLDDELIDADQRLKSLLEQFVRVRVVSTNGLDLSLFQFDTDQSFAVFFLNADGTIYGRFGTRSHRTNWVGDVSIDGLAKALKKSLELHKDFPNNKADLTMKRGPKPEFASPEKFPTLKDKYKSTIDYAGKVVPSCIHCHQIGDAARDTVFRRKEKIPESMLFPYPHPKSVGLILDPKELATVIEVVPKTPAAQAGFEKGDVIEKLAGQPLLSIADVQWVLHQAPAEGTELIADVIRGGKSMQVSMQLEKGWRQRDDISWRASTWGLRRKALGGMFLKSMNGAAGLLVEHVGQYAPHNIAQQAGFRKGDIIVAFDGRTDFTRETDLIAYSLWQKKPGERVKVAILRNGSKQTLTLPIPE